nr:MAG TPA: hypothetical protein [Caudoviricetes sp.]
MASCESKGSIFFALFFIIPTLPQFLPNLYPTELVFIILRFYYN